MEVLIKRQSTPHVLEIGLKTFIINELITPQLFSGKKIIKIKCFMLMSHHIGLMFEYVHLR